MKHNCKILINFIVQTPPTVSSEEVLPVVNSHDVVIGRELRSIIHEYNMLHRAVHTLVLRDDQVYLQKRSMQKDTSPGKWDSSSSGHVDLGESYVKAAIRELDEELGIRNADKVRYHETLLASPETGWEFTAIFTLRTRQKPKPNPIEISDGQWLTIRGIQSWVDQSPGDFAPCFLRVWQRFIEFRKG